MRDKMLSVAMRFALISFAIAGVVTTSSPAVAQVASFPIRSNFDVNGVDLAARTFSLSDEEISIGSTDGRMKFKRYWVTGGVPSNSGYRNNIIMGVVGNVNNPRVNLDGFSESFTLVNGVYNSNEGRGGKLERGGVLPACCVFIYTASDGTVYRFSTTGFGNYWNTSLGVILKIDFPDGETWDYKIKNEYYCGFGSGCPQQAYTGRLQSVVSNRGYQIRFGYKSNTLDNLDEYKDWQSITDVFLVNTAVDNCDPLGDSCSFSQAWPHLHYVLSGDYVQGVETVADSVGQQFQYTFSNGRIASFQRVGSSAGAVSVWYGGSGEVSQVVSDGITWSYNWNDGPTQRTLVRTAPAPAVIQRTVISDLETSLVRDDANAYGQNTHYDYDGSGRPTRITVPEGNSIEYVYDARGNTTFIIGHPKGEAAHASGVPSLVDTYTQAHFPSACVNAKVCNQPDWTEDARQQRTTYAYHDGTGESGGIKDIWAPSVPINGGPASASPHINYSYSQAAAWFFQGGGGRGAGTPIWVRTQSSACPVAASCTNPLEETRTTVIYEAGSASVGTNLLPSVLQRGSAASVISQMSYTYDAIGNVLVTRDPVNRDWFTYYDANRRVIGAIGPDPDDNEGLPRRAKRIAYNSDGLVTKVDEGAVANATVSDLTGFTATRYVQTGYDGTLRKAWDAIVGAGIQEVQVQYSYDAAGRLDCTAQRMNKSTFGAMPGSACTLGTTGSDGPDRISRNLYDDAGRVIYVQNGIGTSLAQNTVAYNYTANGKVANMSDAKSNVTGYTYDGFDRLKRTCYQATAATCAGSPTDYEELSYDAGSRVTNRRLRDAQNICLSYDDLNRLTARFYGTCTGTLDTSYAYDLLGRMTSAVRHHGAQAVTIGAQYDALGRKTSDANSYGGIVKTISRVYDAANRQTSLTVDGLTTTYTYYATGEMTEIKENGTTTLATFGYYPLGERQGIGRPGGPFSTYGYDAIGRLSCLTQSITQPTPSCASAPSTYDQVTAFAYNPASQINSRTSVNDRYAWTQAYNVNRSYASNGLNQYSSITSSGTITPTYDGRGNLASAGSNTYSYSADNELTGANGMRLDYDAFGRMTYSSGSHTRFLYDGPNLVAEYDDSGSLIRRYVHGPGFDEPLVWYEGSGTGNKRWLHSDGRGSIIALSDINGGGGVVNINSYDPWGIPQTTNLGRFQYTGQMWMPELGLYYYKARFYSATLGRFLQTDPIGYEDGPNWYAYVGNDPINGTDPSGLACNGPCPYLGTIQGSYTPSTSQGPQQNFGTGPTLKDFYRISRAANGAAAALAANAPAFMKNPILTSNVKTPAPQKSVGCSRFVSTLGSLNSAPLSAIGAVTAAALRVDGWFSGEGSPTFHMGSESLQLWNAPHVTDAFTLGRVQIYGAVNPGNTKTYDSYTSNVSLEGHENGHSAQAGILGPIGFVGGWLAGGGQSSNNPIEKRADNYARGTSCTGL